MKVNSVAVTVRTSCAYPLDSGMNFFQTLVVVELWKVESCSRMIGLSTIGS